MISGINHLTWCVTDIEETFRFYVDVLSFVPVMKSEWSAYFVAGDVWIAVTKGDRRADSRYDHIAFHVDEEKYDEFVSNLLGLGVEEWKSNESEGSSFYFLDPPATSSRFTLPTWRPGFATGKATGAKT